MNGSCLNLESSIRDAVTRIRFAPQSNNLLVSSWDSSLRLYNVDSLKLRLEAPTKAALLDCCFQNESIALSVGSDCSVRRYDLHTGINNTIGDHDDLATCIEFSDESCQVITAGWDKKVRCWDSRVTKALGCLNTNSSLDVECMCLSGLTLMVASGELVNIFDLRKLNESVHEKELCLDVRIKCIHPTLSSEGFAVGSIDGRVELKYFDPSSSRTDGYAFLCHPKAKEGKRHLAAVNDIAFSPSISGAFVTGDNDGYVTAWDAKSKKRIVELPRYPNSVASLSYSKGGQLLAVASSYTYQEATVTEKPPQIFIHTVDNLDKRSFSAGSSK